MQQQALLTQGVILALLFLLVLALNYLVYVWGKSEQLAPAQQEIWQRYEIYLEDEQLAQFIVDEVGRGVCYEKSELEALVAIRLQNSLVPSELESVEYW